MKHKSTLFERSEFVDLRFAFNKIQRFQEFFASARRKAASGRFSVNLETGESGKRFLASALPFFHGVPLTNHHPSTILTLQSRRPLGHQPLLHLQLILSGNGIQPHSDQRAHIRHNRHQGHQIQNRLQSPSSMPKGYPARRRLRSSAAHRTESPARQ